MKRFIVLFLVAVVSTSSSRGEEARELHVGDIFELRIRVAGKSAEVLKDFAYSYLVEEDGKAYIYRVGPMPVVGVSMDDLTARIKTNLNRTTKVTTVSIVVPPVQPDPSSFSRDVFLTVETPRVSGVVPRPVIWVPGLTLMNVIVRSGAVDGFPDGRIIVQRAGRTFAFSLDRVRREISDPKVFPGDKVILP